MKYMDPAVATEWRKARAAVTNGAILHIQGRTINNIRTNMGNGISVFPHPDGGFLVRKRADKPISIVIVGHI